MAGVATVSSFINLTSTKSVSSPSPSPNHYSFPLRSLHHHNSTRRHGNPRLRICYGKLNGSMREEIDGVFFEGDEMMEDESDEDDTESSADLLFRFLQSMFKKVSKRAKKASRAVLPDVIAPQLVSFAVDGVLLLASLSILKALLEVVCTLGGTVFVVILLLRVIWVAIDYFQSSGNDFNQSGTSYSRTQPVT